MNFCVRPSKSFLFDILEKELGKINGEIGLDAGSSDFKNRRMFKTKKYFGLDIDLAALKNGLKKYPSDNTCGILADLEKLGLLPSNSVDVVVSTNTLNHLPFEKRINALKHLCRITLPTGKFICEVPNDKDLEITIEILKKNFKNLKIIYYKNIFSVTYERIFEKDGFLGAHPIAGLRPFRLFAWLLSRIEFLTKRIAWLNKDIILVCTDSVAQQSNKFEISSQYLIDDRLYGLTNEL